MGTLVRGGDGRGLVIRTGPLTAFGAIALRLGERQGQTAFQQGLQAFSRLLATVTVVLAGSIFVINVALGRSILQSGLFALAIAVGLTPQLLPAIVTVSLATGARRLAQAPGNRQAPGLHRRSRQRPGAVYGQDRHSDRRPHLLCAGARPPGQLGRPCTCARVCMQRQDRQRTRPCALGRRGETAHNNGSWPTLDRLPFDHDRQLASVLVDSPQGRLLVVTKGAPEGVLARCTETPAQAHATLDKLFASGARVVAVASRTFTSDRLSHDDEHDLSLDGFLSFADPAKPDVKKSLARLDRLGVTVKIVTGDNGQVAAHLCHQVGLDAGAVVTGVELAAMDDRTLDQPASPDDHLRPRHARAKIAHHPRAASPRR